MLQGRKEKLKSVLKWREAKIVLHHVAFLTKVDRESDSLIPSIRSALHRLPLEKWGQRSREGIAFEERTGDSAKARGTRIVGASSVAVDWGDR